MTTVTPMSLYHCTIWLLVAETRWLSLLLFRFAPALCARAENFSEQWLSECMQHKQTQLFSCESQSQKQYERELAKGSGRGCQEERKIKSWSFCSFCDKSVPLEETCHTAFGRVLYTWIYTREHRFGLCVKGDGATSLTTISRSLYHLCQESTENLQFK